MYHLRCLTFLLFHRMITASAFIGKAKYHDFVSVMFLPLLPILALGLHWVNKVRHCSLLSGEEYIITFHFFDMQNWKRLV